MNKKIATSAPTSWPVDVWKSQWQEWYHISHCWRNPWMIQHKEGTIDYLHIHSDKCSWKTKDVPQSTTSQPANSWTRTSSALCTMIYVPGIMWIVTQPDSTSFKQDNKCIQMLVWGQSFNSTYTTLRVDMVVSWRGMRPVNMLLLRRLHKIATSVWGFSSPGLITHSQKLTTKTNVYYSHIDKSTFERESQAWQSGQLQEKD
jgi:hypothetical protein